MKKSFMERMAAFIVDKRRLFVVLFAVACVLSVFSVSKTDVNNELTDYLPDSTQTRQGLEIMNREFITYGDAKVMVSNVTFTQAEELAEMLRGVDGVKSVEFEKDTHHVVSTLFPKGFTVPKPVITTLLLIFSLLHCHTAIYTDDLTGNITCIITCQKTDKICNIFDLAKLLHRNTL